MSGAVIAQAIGLALSFVLTRYYTPEDFGTLEQFAMVLGILGVLVTGKYEFAILLPKKKLEADALARLAIRIALISCGAIGILFIIFRSSIARYYNNDDWEYVSWFVGITLLGFGLTNVLNYRLNRLENYKTMSFAKALFSFASEPSKLIFASFGVGSLGLVASVVAGHVVTTLFLLKRNSGILQIRKQLALQNEMAKEFRAYPTYNLSGSLLNRLAQWSHIALFSYFFGLAAIGYLGLCRRVAMLPLTLFSTSFSQVYFKRITSIDGAQELKENYLANLKRLLLISSGMIVAVWILPDNTMTVLFGEDWSEVLNYLRVLIFWFVANFAVSAVSFVNHRLRAQKMMFFLDLLHLVLVIIAIFIAWKLGLQELDSIKALVIAKVIYYLVHILATLRALNKNLRTNSV